MASSKNIKPPVWLIDKENNKLFKQVLALDENDILKKSDAILISILVDAIIDFREADKHIKENGSVIKMKGDRGHVKQTVNPNIAIKKEARTAIIKITQEIGFTPKARAAIQLTEAEADALSPFELALKERTENRRKKK